MGARLLSSSISWKAPQAVGVCVPPCSPVPQRQEDHHDPSVDRKLLERSFRVIEVTRDQSPTIGHELQNKRKRLQNEAVALPADGRFRDSPAGYCECSRPPNLPSRASIAPSCTVPSRKSSLPDTSVSQPSEVPYSFPCSPPSQSQTPVPRLLQLLSRPPVLPSPLLIFGKSETVTTVSGGTIAGLRSDNPEPRDFER